MLVAAVCGCGRDLERYVKDLGDEEEKVRDRAVDELVRMQDESLPALKEALKRSSETERGVRVLKGVMRVLVKSRTHRNQETLQAVGEKTGDRNREVRLVAINSVAALAEVRKSSSTKLLKDAMGDSDPECVRAAAMGLGKLDYDDAAEHLESVLNSGRGIQAVFAAEALHERGSGAAASFLLESISSVQEDVGTAAKEAALRLGTGFVPALARHALEHPGAGATEEVLGSIRDALLEELKRSLPHERTREIMTALAQIADEASAEAMLNIIADGAQSIAARLAAAEAVGEAAASARPAGQPELRDRIVASLKQMLGEKEDERVKIGCAISLCRLQDMVGARYLLDKLEALDTKGRQKTPTKEEARALTELRIRAQDALTSSGEFVVPSLIKAIDDSQTGDITCWAGARTLGDLRARDAVPGLGELLTATVTALAVRPRTGDPQEKFPLKETEPDEEEARARPPSPLARLVRVSWRFGMLVSLVVMLALLLLIFKQSSRTTVGWKPILIIGAIVLAVSFLTGWIYGALVKRSFAGIGASEVFEPTRRTVLGHVFGRERVVPSRDAAVRIEAARALGRIGGPEATALLGAARTAHHNLRVRLQGLIDGKGYMDLVPDNLADEDKTDRARELVAEVARIMIREQEAVLFYIRQALGELGTPPLA